VSSEPSRLVFVTVDSPPRQQNQVLLPRSAHQTVRCTAGEPVVNVQGLRGIRGSDEARILKCWLFPFGKWCVCGIQLSAPGLSLDQKRRRARAAAVSAASTDPGCLLLRDQPALVSTNCTACLLVTGVGSYLVRGKRERWPGWQLNPVQSCCVDAT